MKAKGKRSYFYYLNERGHLYHVFDVKGLLRFATPTAPQRHRSIPTGPSFLTDQKFLDFFFRRVEYNHAGHVNASEFQMKNSALNTKADLISPTCLLEDGALLSPLALLLLFPYVSVCGNELNYIHPQDGVPVVFEALNLSERGEEEKEEKKKPSLVVGTTSLEETFDPTLLKVNAEGKIFHSLTCLKKLSRPPPPPSSLSLSLTPKELPALLTEANNAVASADPTHWVEEHRQRYVSSSTIPVEPISLPVPTVGKAPRDEEEEDYITKVFAHHPYLSPPLGLLGSSIGIQLGLNFMQEDKSSDGHYVIDWEGKTVNIPFME